MNLIDLVRSDAAKNIVLLGQGGAGKTWQMIALFKSILADRSAIPIFISLSSFDDSKNFILNQFAIDYTGVNFDEANNLKVRIKSFLTKECSKNFVFILDAINETSSDYIEYLYDDINFLASFENVKVVISCRYNMVPNSKLFSKYTVLSISDEKLYSDIPNYKLMTSKMKTLLGLPMFYEIYLKLGVKEKIALTQEKLIEKYFEFVLSKMVDVETGTYLSTKYHGIVRRLLFEFLPLFFLEWASKKKNYMIVDDDIIVKWESYKQKFGLKIDKSCVKILLELGILDEINRLGTTPCWKVKHEIYFDYFIDKAFNNKIVRLDDDFSNSDAVLGDIYKTVSFYDEKSDREKAYIYGKKVVNRLEQIATDCDINLQLTIAYGYTVCGYAILHYKNKESNYLEESHYALNRAEQILKYLSNDKNLSDEEYIRYKKIKTTITGNLGAYFYEIKNYLTAQKYHFLSLDERKEMLKLTGDSKYWLPRIAMAHKNIASDFFRFSQELTAHKYGELELAFVNHSKAYEIYKKCSHGMNRDLIICLNRMIGCVIPFIEIELIINPIAELYGETVDKVAGSVLLELYEMLNYFSTCVIIFNEMDDCIVKVKKIIEIVKRKNLTDKNIDIFFENMRQINFFNEYMIEPLSNILGEA